MNTNLGKILLTIFTTVFVFILSTEESNSQGKTELSGNGVSIADYNLLFGAYSDFYFSSFFFFNYFMQLPFENEQGLFTDDTSQALNFDPIFLMKPEYERNPFYRYQFIEGKRTTPGIERSITLDTTDFSLRSEESFEDVDLGYSYSVELDDYLKYREKQIRAQIWDSLVTKYDVRQALSRGDLAKMVAQATGLTIPVPPNPVINLFGKPEISLNVNGEVNLRLGWRWDFQNLGTVFPLWGEWGGPTLSARCRRMIFP